MRKKKITRKYTLSDAELILKGKEKISFFRRDKDAFVVFGISETMIDELEVGLTSFSDGVTDLEAMNNQAEVTQTKKAKVEELRTAIRNVMKRVEFVFGVNTARYNQFGTKGLRGKGDSDLLITAKMVVLIGTRHLQELSTGGVIAGMLHAIRVLCGEVEELIHVVKDNIWERSFQQENRIATGNILYAALVKYASVGFTIWEATNTSKYNDYIIYNRARIF